MNPFTWAVINLQESFGMVLGLIGAVILVRIFLLPVMIHQFRVERKQKEVSEEIAQLGRKYGPKSDRFRKEAYEIYKDAGVGPFTNFIHILFQMVVIMSCIIPINWGGIGDVISGTVFAEWSLASSEGKWAVLAMLVTGIIYVVKAALIKPGTRSSAVLVGLIMTSVLFISSVGSLAIAIYLASSTAAALIAVSVLEIVNMKKYPESQ